MSKKTEKLIILGHSGSGKTYLFKKMLEKGLKPCLKWTTRPMRHGEQQGIDYNFVTESEFKECIEMGAFLTYEYFDVLLKNSESVRWYYGIPAEEFHNSQLFIMTAGEYDSLNLDTVARKKCFVVFLDIDRHIRESRLYIRKDNRDSIERRLNADDLDFANFTDYDLKVRDPEFPPDDIYILMN